MLFSGKKKYGHRLKNHGSHKEMDIEVIMSVNYVKSLLIIT
jgi:hypothetical protein